MRNNGNQNMEITDVDLIGILKRYWLKKKYILISTVVFFIIGLFLALFSEKKFESSCTFIPQINSKSTSSSISSLAAIAGFDVGNTNLNSSISPRIYPQIFDNINFLKEFMYSEIDSNKWNKKILIIDYYTNEEYQTFNLIKFIKKYTIGLPRIIISLFKRHSKNEPNSSIVQDPSHNKFSRREFSCAKAIKRDVMIELDEKNGYITIRTSMNDPLAATEMCQLAFNLLEKYIIEFKISKANNQLSFIKSRYDEKKVEFKEMQIALAEYKDANRVISSSKARTELELLSSEYALSKAIYTELAQQLIQAEIKVKEDTPVLTVITPPFVPNKFATPERVKLLVIWTFLGFVLSCLSIIVFDWLHKNEIKFPKNWN